MDDPNKETIAQAEALALKLRAVVEQTPAYKQWMAAEQLVRSLKGDDDVVSPSLFLSDYSPVMTSNFTRHLLNYLAHRPDSGKHIFYGGGEAIPMPPKPKKLSQADAAEIVLRRAMRPMPTPEIVEAIQAEGAQVGGSDPLVNVSSTLSKDARFVSQRWGSQSAWWLVGEPIPDSEQLRQQMMDLGFDDKEAGGQTPAVVEPK